VKALVTGATGFIGSHLVEHLLKNDFAVRVLLRRTSDTVWLKDLPLETVTGDLFDERALSDAVNGVDYIYHSAGVTKARTVEGYYRGNTEGTKNILGAVLRKNPSLKRFVHVSSQAAAGPSPGSDPINEEVEPHPITTYGRSKWASEQECLRHRGELPITIVRPAVVYGPREKDVFEFFHTYARGLQPMAGMKEKYVSMLHVSDLVRGILLASESTVSVGETYFLTSGTAYGWKDIGESTRRAMGRKALRVKIPEWGIFAVAAFAEAFAAVSRKPALINFEKARDMVQDYWTSSPEKATRDFGFRQEISLEAGIRETVAWYKAMKWL
jgi:nucleoside-diphosphate-sugar epimerase